MIVHTGPDPAAKSGSFGSFFLIWPDEIFGLCFTFLEIASPHATVHDVCA